jgi:adenylate cyclase
MEEGRTPAGKTALRELVLATEPGPGITVYLQRSWDEALEPLRQQQRFILALGVAGFAVTVLFGFILAEGVTAPVIKLVGASQRLAAGDYGARVDISQRDEIGQLGRTFNWMVEGLEQKEKIRALLRKAVSKEIAEELIRRGEINLGGEEKKVTVLFADIRGFTAFSEGASAPQVVAQLNDYFGRMAGVIDQHHGVIDKFIGDAVMAIFGAPISTAADVDNALRAALGIARALERLNEDRERKGLAPWTNVIGLNTGPAVVGTMGSSERWSYTVVGDSVNLASRLESLTRYYGVRIALSSATKEAAKGDFLFRTLDLVRVKGKRETIEVFELLGEAAPAPEWLGHFEEGVRAFRESRFAQAKILFQNVLRLSPQDAPCRIYLERLEPLLTSVPADWDPVVTMSEK